MRELVMTLFMRYELEVYLGVALVLIGLGACAAAWVVELAFGGGRSS